MRKIALIGLATGLAFASTTALAEPISESDAHRQCWNWTYHMGTHSSVCGFCEYFTMRPQCHFYACDETGCDVVTVERRAPRGRWSVGSSSPVIMSR